jgi:hypothetical protein
MLASLATTSFTIFLGSLQLSASAYGSTTFESDLAAATGYRFRVSGSSGAWVPLQLAEAQAITHNADS